MVFDNFPNCLMGLLLWKIMSHKAQTLAESSDFNFLQQREILENYMVKINMERNDKFLPF